MDWLLPIAALVGTWAFLRVLGNEAARRNRDLDYHISRIVARQSAQAAAAAEAAAKSRPGH